MGRLYAERAVAEGAAAVVLWDRDSAGLAGTAAELGAASGGRTRIAFYVVDISDLGAIAQTAQRVRTEVGNPDVLINNAAVVVDKYFWDHDNGDDTRTTMQVNALAPMYITREFLPGMIRHAYRPARIVNIASSAGSSSHPGRSVYAASKAALVGWSDSLRRELQQQDHGNIKVTTVCPSHVSGSKYSRGSRLPAVSAELVVDRVWRAMLAGTPMLVLPRVGRLSATLRGVLPLPVRDAVAERMLSRRARRGA
jgi:NAD(P)-dependent dehydrogenase (short-subunit alcohol dehydrogenase family)